MHVCVMIVTDHFVTHSLTNAHTYSLTALQLMSDVIRNVITKHTAKSSSTKRKQKYETKNN